MAKRREILLAFGTANLDKARKAVASIYKQARDAAKQVQDIDKRKELLRQAKESQIEQRQLIAEERDRQKGEAVSLRQRRRARAGFQEAGRVELGALASGSPTGIAQALLRAAPGLGTAIAPAAAVFALVAPHVADFVTKRLEAFEAARLGPLLARLERAEADLLTVRLQEDEPFRRRLLREDVRQDRARQGLLIRSADVTRFSQ